MDFQESSSMVWSVSQACAIVPLSRLKLANQINKGAFKWSPPGKPGAPLPSAFDSLRSLRTTPRFSGGMPSEWPQAMAGGRVEGSQGSAAKTLIPMALACLVRLSLLKPDLRPSLEKVAYPFIYFERRFYCGLRFLSSRRRFGGK